MFNTSILILPRIVSIQAGNDGYWLPLAAFLLGSVYIFILTSLTRRFPGESIVEFAPKIVSKPIGVVICIAFVIKLIISMGLELRMFGEMISLVLLSNTPLPVIILAMLFAVYYLIKSGIEASGRMAEVLVYFVFAPLIIIVCVIMLKTDYKQLLPLFQAEPIEALKGIYYVSLTFMPLEFILIMAAMVNKTDSIRPMAFWALGIICLLEVVLIVLTFTGVGTTEVRRQIWPILTLMQSVALPGSFLQNQEILMMSWWVLSIYMYLSGGIYFATVLCSRLMRFRRENITALPLLPIIFFVAMIPQSSVEAWKLFVKFQGIVGIWFLCIIPLVLLLIAKVRGLGAERVQVKSRHSKILSVLLIMCLTLPLVGCWDNVEINNRSVILEFLLDKDMTQDKAYSIIYNIPDMAKLSGTSSLSEDVQTSFQITAPTIFKSIDDLEVRTQNTVSFSHVKGILVGENLVKDQELFSKAMDDLTRDLLLPRNTPLLIVPDGIGQVAQLENPQNPILGLYLMNYFNNKERPIHAFKTQLLSSFIREMEDYHISTLPVFNLLDKQTIEISGGAVVKDYTLQGYLNKEEVKGQLFVDGTLKNAPVMIDYKGDTLTYNVKGVDTKMHFEPTSQGVKCILTVLAKGNIAEYISSESNNLFDNYEAREMDQIRNLLAQQIKKEIRLTVDKSQEMNVDFLRIGLELYRKEPKLWKAYQQVWDEEMFKNLPIEIEVTAKIQNTGILQ
jgi:spore germination protein